MGEQAEWTPPGLDPMPVEFEEYCEAVMDVKLELVQGFLIDGLEDSQRRERLFLLLLKNIGLSRAIELVARQLWEEALRSAR